MPDTTKSPIIHPVVATPQAQLKRKRESVDLTQAALRQRAEATASAADDVSGDPSQPAAGEDRERKIEDEELDSDEDSMFEDALDEIELNPFVPEDDHDEESFSEAAAETLRARLREIGVEEFFKETINIRPRKLGTAFGIDPQWGQMPEEFYLRILGLAVVRAYNKRQKLSEFNTIDDAANLLQKCRNIMIVTGAGISTSLGIPDFRSKETGFYEKVRQLGYSEGEDVFNIENFDHDPTMFYTLAGDILPDLKRYSPTHAFIRMVQDKGRLQTNYTQNIDNLEQLAGIEKERLIQCHGSFATASCRKCKYQVDGHEIFAAIRSQQVAYCKECIKKIATAQTSPAKPTKKRKTKPKNDYEDSDSDPADTIPQPGVMKPDITFFGEQLPTTFFDRFTEHDSQTVDLVLVIGTSLKVAPVSEMPNYLPHHVPHVYISREPIHHVNFDIQLLGDCDHVVFELARRAGWVLEHEMIPRGFGVTVAEVAESGHRWAIRPVMANAD
ncbi:Hypothetical protein R9X50_00239400 [Acrodontium crateriforme]|uniref:Deacetylase sirtuin-type domain-containing protein n=1 Tax=Acrodontium crateriforme TaxID=150365 RepID=A0AAQ3M0R2_9PEZI|nr:Hypothetical protein R9X50_00239400 [Acrodontium crateriforme]